MKLLWYSLYISKTILNNYIHYYIQLNVSKVDKIKSFPWLEQGCNKRHSSTSSVQVKPVDQGSQRHLKEFTPSTQVDPFAQGADKHSLMFISQLIPENPEPHRHLERIVLLNGYFQNR